MVSRKEIAKEIKNLPTLSTAVVRLSALLNDENASAADFETVIRPDPALTTNLLRFANSAYFALRTEVTSVRNRGRV